MAYHGFGLKSTAIGRTASAFRKVNAVDAGARSGELELIRKARKCLLARAVISKCVTPIATSCR